MEVAPGIHRFETGPFNWFVVADGNRLTVIDAGFPAHYAVLRDGLSTIGRTFADISALVLTHAHADHMGFAERLRRELGIPVYLHSRDAVAASRVLQLPWWGLLSNAWRPHVRAMLSHAIRAGVFATSPVRESRHVAHGDILDVPGSPQILHVPGHTHGEICLYFAARHALVSGDALVTLDLMTGEHGSPQLPHRLLNARDREARSALDRLRECGHVTLLPGHGRPWRGAIDTAIDDARQRSTFR